MYTQSTQPEPGKTSTSRLNSPIWKQRIELTAAILISIATVFSAWCAYQSRLWTHELQIKMKERQPQKPDLFTEVNAYLEAKTMLDSEIPTNQRIAEELGFEEEELNDWAKTDNEFRGGLEKLTKIQDENLFSEPELDNPADVMLVALFLLETKSRHEMPNV